MAARAMLTLCTLPLVLVPLPAAAMDAEFAVRCDPRQGGLALKVQPLQRSKSALGGECAQ